MKKKIKNINWLNADKKTVRNYLEKNTNIVEYDKKKAELIDKIGEQSRRDMTDKYIQVYCGNYTDKEKTIVRNAIQIGWDLRNNIKK